MKLDSSDKLEEAHASLSQVRASLPKPAAGTSARSASARTRSSSAESNNWVHKTAAAVKTFEMPYLLVSTVIVVFQVRCNFDMTAEIGLVHKIMKYVRC